MNDNTAITIRFLYSYGGTIANAFNLFAQRIFGKV